MNVNFKYKHSCSQKPDKIKQYTTFLDVFRLQKIYKINKNVALATIMFC